METLQILDLPVIEEVNQDELIDIYGGVTFTWGLTWSTSFPLFGGTFGINLGLSDEITF